LSFLHVEPFENRGDESLQAKTDAGASAVFLAVDFDAKELVCQAEVGEFVLFQEPGLNFNRSFHSIFWVQQRDVIHV